MLDTSQASKDRMGRLNNDLTILLDKHGLTPLETLAVLRLMVTRIERAFEVSVMPRTVKGKK